MLALDLETHAERDMGLSGSTPVVLDYGEAGNEKLLKNLSGSAVMGDVLWTVSDEGRTLECLVRSADAFELHRQVRLDDLGLSIPGAGASKPAELDLESIDLADGVLWLCGSHCRVRKKSAGNTGADEVTTPLSRSVLAALTLSASGREIERARALPFEGEGSLRHALGTDPFLTPFLDFPTKENGIDIEGIVAHGDSVYLGMRGPVIDGRAVIVRLRLDDDLAIRHHELCVLDLGGLGVRDLARGPSSLLVLAGPMGEPTAPFHLHAWQPGSSPAEQSTHVVLTFPDDGEKPEGICMLTRDGEPGLLVVYDNPKDRIRGTTYVADWIALP